MTDIFHSKLIYRLCFFQESIRSADEPDSLIAGYGCSIYVATCNACRSCSSPDGVSEYASGVLGKMLPLIIDAASGLHRGKMSFSFLSALNIIRPRSARCRRALIRRQVTPPRFSWAISNAPWVAMGMNNQRIHFSYPRQTDPRRPISPLADWQCEVGVLIVAELEGNAMDGSWISTNFCLGCDLNLQPLDR